LVAADAVEALQDLGAAGLSCATSEVAARSHVGMQIDVSLVPRRAQAMSPYEVMLSESQERMLVVARPGRERDVERIFDRWELHGARIGEVTVEPLLRIFDADQLVASLPPRSLADDAPEYDISDLAATYSGTDGGAVGGVGAPSPEPHQMSAKIGLELLDLLASPAVTSRRAIYRTYDQMVGTDTVVGPGADAAVMRIKGRADGIAIAIDAQPRLAALDPFVGAAAAVAEATRNLVCMGATPLAITDCLNIGNPERPKGAWQLTRTIEGITAACEALSVPVVSGNVALENATQGADTWPPAFIGAVGQLADVKKHIPPTSGKPGDLVLFAGSAQVSLGASAYGALHGVHEGPVAI